MTTNRSYHVQREAVVFGTLSKNPQDVDDAEKNGFNNKGKDREKEIIKLLDSIVNIWLG